MAKILVIDDEEMILETVRQILEKDAHEVSLAGNGREGMQYLSANDTDIVITDIIMPEKEGLETILEIKTRYPDIKIIAMSGGGRIQSSEYLRAAEVFGVNAVLRKPFRAASLAEAVDTCLSN
jgi:YesN/AraC family two-component response regulator